MALILEVLDSRSRQVRERLRLDGAAITIGRALSNILVLDDPYVDAHHAELRPAGDGTFVLEDLGSRNLIHALGTGRTARFAIVPGSEVAIGRTTIRFRDEHAPVAPALELQEDRTGRSLGFTKWSEVGTSWHERTAGRVMILVTMLAVLGLDSWLESVQRAAAFETLTVVLAIGVVSIVWAGIWSVAARAVTGRFRFLAHLSVVALAIIVLTLITASGEWFSFLFPANVVFEPLHEAASFVVFLALIASHLKWASYATRARRWRSAGIIGAIVLTIFGAFTLLEDDAFTARAEFPGQIKLITPSLVPMQSADEFATTIRELRIEIDSLVARQTP